MVIIIEENYLSALFEENKTKIEAGEIKIEKIKFHIWIKFYSIQGMMPFVISSFMINDVEKILIVYVFNQLLI